MTDPLSLVCDLLQAPEQGGAAARVRRARQALLEAGSSAEAAEAIGLESAVLALGEALSQAGLGQASQRCGERVAKHRSDRNIAATEIAALNSWVFPRSLRRYQLTILEGHPLSLAAAGNSYQLRDCQADPDRNHLLLQRESDASLWWLRSSECSDGYLLDASVLEPAESTDLRQIDALEPVLIRAGNSNFAHFLWNELDPLLRLIDAGHTLEAVQDADTVLDLAQLGGIRRVPANLVKERRSLRVGGTLVTTQAGKTVLEALGREAEGPDPADHPQPLILLGVRGPGRRELRNEVEFLIALIDAITQHFHRPLILLDGFTYQHDNQQHHTAQERERACSARIEQILAQSRHAQLESLCGLNIATWLQRCDGVRFYVTHEGTMQHKLGWLRPEIPGLCLVGSKRAEAIATWHRLQCEGAGQPITLPIELYQQDAVKPPHSAAEERNQPFTIQNVAQAVALTMHHIKACLELDESQAESAIN